MNIDAIDFEQGKAARAQDEMLLTRDRIARATRGGYAHDRDADCHAFAVTTLLCSDRRTDESGSAARRAYYGAY